MMSLREEVSNVLSELDTMCKVVCELAVLPPDARSCPEKVDKVVSLIASKQRSINDICEKAKAHTERHKVIEKLKEEVNIRDEYIEKIQTCLKNSETTLMSAIFQANQKLKSIYQADARKVTVDELITYAHLISKTNAVAAPLSWKQGDPERPFPTDAQMRQGVLGSAPKPTPPAFLPTSAGPNRISTPGHRVMSPHQQAIFPQHMASPAMHGAFPQPPGMRMANPGSLQAPPPYGSVGHRQQWNQPTPNRPFLPHMPISVGGRTASPRTPRPPFIGGRPATPAQQRPASPRTMQSVRPRLPAGIIPPGMKLQPAAQNSAAPPPAKKPHVEVDQMSSDSSSNSSSSDSPS